MAGNRCGAGAGFDLSAGAPRYERVTPQGIPRGAVYAHAHLT